MRVELTRDVFREEDNDPSYDLHALIDLLRCFIEHRHEWVTDEGIVAAVEAFAPNNIPKRLAATYVALARDAAKARTWVGTTQAEGTVRVGRGELDDYSRDLCQPAVLVVENQESDGHFVAAIAHAFGSDRVLIALEQRWLVIENGGGSTLVPVARSAAKRFRRKIRVFALLDSDRLVPKQETSCHAKGKTLAEHGIAVHVLALREAENYAPYGVLASIGRRPEASRRLDHFKRLERDQRAHFDMKKGFAKPRSPAGSPPEIRAEQRSLFDGLAPAILVGLHHGFGNDILRRMHEMRESLSERDFEHLGPESVAELRDLLARLADTI